MRRLALLAAALSIFAAILYGASLSRREDVLVIGAIPTSRSLLIDPGNGFFVTVYFSRSETLFVRRELIRDVKMVAQETEAALTVVSIERREESVLRNSVRYYAYRFALSLGFDVQDGFALEWRDAVLKIAYEDGAALEVSIGTLALRFGAVSGQSPLTLERLYGRKGTTCGIERILVGLKNQSTEPLAIDAWQNGMSETAVVAERTAPEHPGQAVERLDRFGAAVTSETVTIPAGGTLYLVLRLSDAGALGSRHFYLSAVWRGLGTNGTFLIDDFVYVAEEGGGCDGGFVESVFRYPR